MPRNTKTRKTAKPYKHTEADSPMRPEVGENYLILETKGFDPLDEVKAAAAQRWVAAVNAEASYGHWQYAVARKVSEVGAAIFAHAPGQKS